MGDAVERAQWDFEGVVGDCRWTPGGDYQGFREENREGAPP